MTREKTMAIDLSTVPMISRNRMFHDSLRRVTAKLLENDTVKHVGGKASGNSYCAGVTRQRVRALARTMARDEMRSIRKGE
jgi:hypothetical protein